MIRGKGLIVIALIVLLGLWMTGCGKTTDDLKIEPGRNESTKVHRKISVWAAYWDLDRIPIEVGDLEDSIRNLCYFAAYFDPNNQLMIPEETTKIFKTIEDTFEDNEWTNYLTVVNDKINADGTSDLKDTQLLYKLFESDEAMNAHIDQIVSLASSGGYDGIEIDYEAMKMDMKLWKLYEEFCAKLYREASELGLSVRVVLEPNAPIEKLSLPKGPTYIMMCYNLHGPNTEPGPKADAAFIRELMEKMSEVDGNKEFALATGGFDWKEGGKAAPVTEIQAEKLIKQYGAEPERDQESQCVKFTYEDSKGKKHEIWYADVLTLRNWMDIISENGDAGISLWRLGGNNSHRF